MRRRRQRSSRSCTAPAVLGADDLEADDVVAELDRQGELGLGRRRAGGEGEGRLADDAALDVAGADEAGGGRGARRGG